MKRISTLATLAFAAFLAASLAVPSACAQGVVLRARVPFPFTVAETSMPAGNYLISSPSSGVIRIANADNNMAAAVTTTHDFQEPRGENKLIFNKYGEQYFLHTVICSETAQMNVDFATWKAEKSVRAREAAKLNRPETVMVAAK